MSYYVRGVYLYRKTWYNVNAAGDGTPGKYLEVFMEAYSDFARVYDIFMDNVEYEKWAEYLIGRRKSQNGAGNAFGEQLVLMFEE